MVKTLMLTLLLWGCFQSKGQDFTNKGKEFWLGFGNHQQMYTSSLPGMDIYITSDVNTRVTIDIPAMGILIGTYEIRAGEITTIDNITQQSFLIDEGVSNKGIHIVAQAPVVVYAQIYNASVTGATLCLPVSTLGKEYYSVNFTQVAQRGPTNESSYSYFFVVAMEDNTRVQVTPSANSLSGNYRAGQTYELNLNRGEVFNFLSRTDLTGSVVRAIDNGAGCKKIAMFCGSGRIGIGCGNDVPSSDNLFQQMYPASTWGRKYLTVPSATRPLNFYRIIRPDPATRVRVDGLLIASGLFLNNFYYQFSDSRPHVVEADRPILVAQYYTTQNCGEETFNGDPEMIFLNPVEQTVKVVTLTSMKLINGVNPIHFINAIVRNNPAAINSFSIDGQAFISSFNPHPSDPAYAYAQIQVNYGRHIITCDSSFNAVAYGFSQNESYGYSAGANLTDLYQYLTVENDHSAINFPASCLNTPFRLAMTFPFQPSHIQWIFGPALNALGIRDTVINSPVPDSSWVADGAVTLYRYRLKRPDRVGRVGIFPIRVVVVNPGSDRCSGEQGMVYDFQVFDKPLASFSVTHNGCITDAVFLKDEAVERGRPITAWYWNPGNGQAISGDKDYSLLYTDAGTFTISHAVVSDLGCTSDTVRKVIRVSALPVVGFELRSPPCVSKDIRLANTSVSSGDPLTAWNWDFGDGQTLTATSGSPLIHQYGSTGSYPVTLQVSTARGCRSAPLTQFITVHPNPVANFGVPRICIDDPYAQFTDSSSIADGTEASFSWSWRFGDNSTGTEKNPQHRYAAPGNYQVGLTVTSEAGCSAGLTKPITVNGRVQVAGFASLPGERFCANRDLQIADASRLQSGTPLQVVIWWDYNQDPTIKTIDDTPAIGKRYTHTNMKISAHQPPATIQ